MKESSLQNRSIYHDLLRIFASLAVICIHVCSNSATWAEKLFSTPTWSYLNVFDSLSRFSVPVFIMLSGSFMLDKYKNSSLKKLYSHNILRLVTAFFAWSIFYVCCSFFWSIVLKESFSFNDVPAQVFTGAGHQWFIPMLVFLYMITPLLCNLCKDKKTEKYYILLCFIPIIFNFIHNYIGLYSFYSVYKNANLQFVSGYSVYFVLGHYLTKYDISKKIRIPIYFLSLLSIVFTILVSYKHYISGNTDQSYAYEYLSPTVLIVAVSVFLFFKYVISKINFKEKAIRFIIKLSSLTFGVYLSHMIFVKLFSHTPLTVENINPIISVPLLTLLIFILSAAITWVISKIPVLKKYII